MDGGQDLTLGRSVQPVAETAQAFEEPPLELHPVGALGRMPERPEAGDVLVMDPAIYPARLHQAQLQAARRGAEADKHCSGKE